MAFLVVAERREQRSDSLAFSRLANLDSAPVPKPLVAAEPEHDDGGTRRRATRTWTPLVRALEATGDHWTLAIALALAPGRTRLAHLRERLPGVSTGVLERGLQQMVDLGLISRSRFKEKPPRVELELTDAGLELVPIAEALAHWGMRHLWSQPNEGERVDVPALLQLLPSLIGGGADLPDGSLEAVLTDADTHARFRYRVSDGQLSMIEGSREPTPVADAARPLTADRPAARIHGTTQAWSAALGPTGEEGTLDISGDEPLAQRVLDALPGSRTTVCHNGSRGGQRRDPQSPRGGDRPGAAPLDR
jgi:DNA-binding HxlR family transcriptional regulator